MPLLTDRQEPEDFDRSNPDDPNEYAIRYLFNANNSNRDLARAAQILLYSSAGANLLAFLLYLAWVEFQFTLWVLALALLVVVLSGLAALAFKNGHTARAGRLAGLPLSLTLISLLLLYGLSEVNAVFFFFFLPGSSAMLLASLLFSLSRRAPAQE